MLVWFFRGTKVLFWHDYIETLRAYGCVAKEQIIQKFQNSWIFLCSEKGHSAWFVKIARKMAELKSKM